MVSAMQMINKPSSLHKNFVSRCLESEIQFLQGILENLEKSEWPEDLYIKESLKLSAMNIRDLVKYLS